MNPFAQPLLQPPIGPAELGYIAQQEPSSGKSLPMRYQNSHGRRQAAAPYAQPSHPGMAQTSANDSGAGRVRKPPPIEETECWVQYGTDHTGLWTCPKESRTDSVDPLSYEVEYVDLQRM